MLLMGFAMGKFKGDNSGSLVALLPQSQILGSFFNLEDLSSLIQKVAPSKNNNILLIQHNWVFGDVDWQIIRTIGCFSY